MMTIMIIFERDKPRRILLWSVVFLLTNALGYLTYLLLRLMTNNKRKALYIKQAEDEIYEKLISSKYQGRKANAQNEVFKFAELAFNSNTTANNSFDFFSSYVKAKEQLAKDLKNAKQRIVCEASKINAEDFDQIKTILMEKARNNVLVKFVYDRGISRKFIKALKSAGVRVYKFSKLRTCCSTYANLRNIVSIDGKVVWLGNFDISKKQLISKTDMVNSYTRIMGDVVQEIDVDLHQDAVFAGGKFIKFMEHTNDIKNNSLMQYVSNEVESEMKLLIIKAICSAKSSIQLQVDKFIPTESVMSLLKFAINSNIDVRLMIPMKSNRHGKVYASRAYAKELALMGANVYLYDGYITANSIVVDNEYVISGDFTMDRAQIGTNLQNFVLISDEKATAYYNKLFDDAVNNSYRINNAKFMLGKEKFFRNFE